MESIYDINVTTIDGVSRSLGNYRDYVLLIVNVASQCGFTPQYSGLEELHRRYGEKGLRVLGFPANDFGAQEPGTEADIKSFCSTNYGVSFDMFAKVGVKGANAHPLYRFLQDPALNPKHELPVKWNFHKYLIGRDGLVIASFTSNVDPLSDELVRTIEETLAAR